MHPSIIYENIKTEDIYPSILGCSIFTSGKTMPHGYHLGTRYVYDYELEFFTYGGGGMMIENNTYPVNKGDIVFRRPGQYVEGIMPYACYLLCFDLSGKSGKDYKGYDFSKQIKFQNFYKNKLMDEIPPIFHPSSEDIYFNLFDSIFRSFINSSESSIILIKSLITKLIYEIYSDVSNSLDENNQNINSPYNVKLKRARDFMNSHIEQRIALNDIASACELSPTYFHRIFTQTFQITPNEYLNKIRINKARELIIKTELPIKTISLMCGFENTPYFSTIFKKYNNLSPIEFRNKHSYI